MIRNDTWELLRGIWPRFPSTGWDHWLRHGSGLRPRECVVPEVSRTHHFDTRGTNVKAGSPLAKALADMVESRLPPGRLGDISYLLHEEYEARVQELIQGATVVDRDDLADLPHGTTYVLPYVREEYSELAKRLRLSPAQPRTAHRGLILTRHPSSGAELLLVDRRKAAGWLREEEQWLPHSSRKVSKAKPGESCDGLCRRLGMRCDARELEFVNTCELLKSEFACESGCGHQVGLEIPCYVHDSHRDTALQCLVTDDAKPTCGAQCPATTRLCACVPK